MARPRLRHRRNDPTRTGHTFQFHYLGYEGQSAASMKADAKDMFKHFSKEMRRRNLSFVPDTLGHGARS